MPFKSQAQRRKFAQLLVEEKISNETLPSRTLRPCCGTWLSHGRGSGTWSGWRMRGSAPIRSITINGRVDRTHVAGIPDAARATRLSPPTDACPAVRRSSRGVRRVRRHSVTATAARPTFVACLSHADHREAGSIVDEAVAIDTRPSPMPRPSPGRKEARKRLSAPKSRTFQSFGTATTVGSRPTTHA